MTSPASPRQAPGLAVRQAQALSEVERESAETALGRMACVPAAICLGASRIGVGDRNVAAPWESTASFWT